MIGTRKKNLQKERENDRKKKERDDQRKRDGRKKIANRMIKINDQKKKERK